MQVLDRLTKLPNDVNGGGFVKPLPLLHYPVELTFIT